MKNLKDEIEGILGRNGIYNYRKTYVYSSAEDARANRAMGTEVEQLPVIKELTSLIEQEKERVRKETREQAVREFVKVCHKNEIYGDTGIVTGNFIDSGNSDLECLAEQYLAERKE